MKNNSKGRFYIMLQGDIFYDIIFIKVIYFILGISTYYFRLNSFLSKILHLKMYVYV